MSSPNDESLSMYLAPSVRSEAVTAVCRALDRAVTEVSRDLCGVLEELADQERTVHARVASMVGTEETRTFEPSESPTPVETPIPYRPRRPRLRASTVEIELNDLLDEDVRHLAKGRSVRVQLTRAPTARVPIVVGSPVKRGRI